MSVLDSVCTSFVAHDALADLISITFFQLFAPIRICKKRSTQSDNICLSTFQDTLCKRRTYDSSNSADWNVDLFFHFSCNVSKECIWLNTHRWNGICHIPSMICLCHMEHIYSGFLKPFCKYNRFLCDHSALSSLWSNNSQLVINDHIWNCFSERCHKLDGKSCTVLKTSTILICSVV